MSADKKISCVVAAWLLAAAMASFAEAAPVDDKVTPWPTDEGIPVNQWYMRTTDADGTKLRHYIAEYGAATKPENTVIVLHGGWGAEHSYLVPAIRPLADRYRFVLYDQRGSLRTPADSEDISFAALVEDLDQLRQRLGLEKVTLMAHSMGNHLAYGYLRAHPDRVAGLVLVGAVTPDRFGVDEPVFLHDVWPSFSQADLKVIAARRSKWEADFNERALRIMVAEGLIPADWAKEHPPGTDPDFKSIYKWTDQQTTMAWRIQFTAVNTYDSRNWRQMAGGQVFYNEEVAGGVLNDPKFDEAVAGFWPALKAFKGPARVIIGTDDYVDLGPTYWPLLIKAMADARLDTIRNAGHSSWMDQPEAFTHALRTALADTTGRDK
ncbi:MAG: alpha/beta hydrolase [Sinobacteraceae bacterium]|nr:alpha/beta hydrolase [Nevskiaceae bacterium]